MTLTQIETTTNELLIQQITLLKTLIDQQREEIEILRNIQLRSGSKPQHYDITIDLPEPNTFRLIFNLRFVKDNPELKEKNKELKARVQATITAGLGANKHYVLNKVEKSNTAKTTTWQEWQFVFNACYADAIGQRIEALIESDKIGVKGLDELATLAKSAEQIPLGTSNQDPLIQQIHILGNEWAKLCNPELGDWKARHGAITRQYFNKDSTTELTAEQKEKYIRWLLRTMLRELGTRIWGSRFIGDLETQMIQVEYPDAENYQNLTTSQLRSLKTKWENQLGAKERRF